MRGSGSIKEILLYNDIFFIKKYYAYQNDKNITIIEKPISKKIYIWEKKIEGEGKQATPRLLLPKIITIKRHRFTIRKRSHTGACSRPQPKWIRAFAVFGGWLRSNGRNQPTNQTNPSTEYEYSREICREIASSYVSLSSQRCSSLRISSLRSTLNHMCFWW